MRRHRADMPAHFIRYQELVNAAVSPHGGAAQSLRNATEASQPVISAMAAVAMP